MEKSRYALSGMEQILYSIIFAFGGFVAMQSHSLSSLGFVLELFIFLAIPSIANRLVTSLLPKLRIAGLILLFCWALFIVVVLVSIGETIFLQASQNYPKWLAKDVTQTFNIQQMRSECGDLGPLVELKKENGTVYRCGNSWLTGKTFIVIKAEAQK